MSERVNDLIATIRTAQLEVKNLKGDDDGTCNFDQPLINLTGWQRKEVKELQDSGLVKDKLGSKYWRGYFYLDLSLPGQANLRTRAAELAHKMIKEAGFTCHMYYAMD